MSVLNGRIEKTHPKDGEAEAALAAALDPMSSADLLEWAYQVVSQTKVYQSDETKILDALAQNPSIPLDLVYQLCYSHTKMLRENPAIPLLMLEYPGATGLWSVLFPQKRPEDP